MSSIEQLAASLTDRVESASPALQSALIKEAWLALNPKPEIDIGPDWPGKQFMAWETAQFRLGDMLRVDAYESAAMMLVREGWHLHTCSDAPVATIYKPTVAHNRHTKAHGSGSTVALAITSAALRAYLERNPEQ